MILHGSFYYMFKDWHTENGSILDLTPISIEEASYVYPYGALSICCHNMVYLDSLEQMRCGRCHISCELQDISRIGFGF